ncbi:MAG: PDZ domain-containing protein [Alphaproteobacteria bacterium]|nr:PDZ domain-containing protein [Alphaproteobacteria bacterium]
MPKCHWPALPKWFLVIALVAAIAVPQNARAEEDTGDVSSNDTFKQLSLFSDVLERVRADYVDPVTDEKLIESSINGMLTALDPHSAYLNKKNFQEMQTQTRGEFGGLGLEVTMEGGLVKVVSPIDGTPAANAGMQPGDLITHIDGKPVADLSLSEAVDIMRGSPGSKVTLTVRRGGLAGQPFDVAITRAVIRIQSVRFRQEGEDVGYIRITTFNEQTQTGLDKAIDELGKTMGKKLIGYVLDLRNNPGGLLDQAVSVSGTFLEPGIEVVSTRGRHAEDNQSFTAKGGDRAKGKPIIVLINGGSASASEIVAGALQDHRRGIVLGTKSFGKGSVQTIIPIAGSGAMRLTTARYYTPAGRSIQQLGIEPDITVQPAKLEEVAQGMGVREADLKGALPNPNGDGAGGEKETAAADDGKKSEPGEKKEPFDYQLARGIDLLRGLYLFENKDAPPPKTDDKAEGDDKAGGKPDKK